MNINQIWLGNYLYLHVFQLRHLKLVEVVLSTRFCGTKWVPWQWLVA